MTNPTNPVPCPKCGRLFVWDGTRCVNRKCRLGSAQKPLRPRKKVAPDLPPPFEVRWQSASPMDSRAITQLLGDLKRTKYGWRAVLPVEFGNFFGRPVGIDFQTREVPERRPPPAVSESEKELVRTILLRLREVLQEAERQFEQYNAGADPPAVSMVADPQIWLHREDAEVAHPTRWALVVGARRAPDFGWHLEYDGTEFREIWAGD
jgi:hypothetical protein